MKKVVTLVAVSAVAGSALAVDFFGTADDTGYQGNSASLSATHLLSAEIRGLETLWSSGGFAHANAGFGSVIGVDDFTSGGTSQAVYRVDSAFSGVPSLVQIATINSRPVSDLTVGNGKIYGVRNVGGSGSNLEVVEFDTSFNVTNTYDTGIAIADVAAGGLAYDAVSDSFYLTDPDADSLWNWSIGGSATLVGVNGFDFDNNDLAIDPNTGTLYGAIENVSDNSWEFGYWNTNSGQFTSLVIVDDSSGSVGLAIPSPATLAMLGLGGLVAGRRRR